MRRRPPGDRVLVYLDHSTLSALARHEPGFGALRRLLAEAVDGDLLCPYSPEHRDESVLARDDSYEAIDSLGDELSIGIEFRSREQIEWREIYAAAAAFLGDEPKPVWKEAFREDPHVPRDDRFFEFMGGRIRLKVRFPVDDGQRAEVRHEKAKEDPIEQAYEVVRGLSFEEVAEANLEAMLTWKVGPLFDAERFMGLTQTRWADLLREWLTSEGPNMEPDSALNRYLAFAIRDSQTESLIERYPALRDRVAEFKSSTALRSMPTLRYPALLRAALATDPTKRKARPSDGYDIEHLTIGLSRCDIVTADRAMTRIVRERRLIPTGCELFEFSDVSGFTAAIEATLASRRPPAGR
jgi:hypothetical protein